MPVIEAPLDATIPGRHAICQGMLNATGGRGSGSAVAVLDTGFDPAWLATQQGEVADRFAIESLDFTSGQEGWREPPGIPHGSRIISDICTYAPEAKILSLRVIGAQRAATRADYIPALEWCASQHIAVVNLSVSFYSGCSEAAPCILCRTINSVALASGMFVCIVGGDAWSLGRMIDGKTVLGNKGVALCPAARGSVGWAIASPEVVMAGSEVVKNAHDGLSFTTGKFSAGVTQIRGLAPTLDLFEVRRAIRCTCVRSPHLPPEVPGFGPHCFFMAGLAAAGMVEQASGRLCHDDPHALRQPSERLSGVADRQLVRGLQVLCLNQVRTRDWQTTLAQAQCMLDSIAPWASKLDLAMVHHVIGSCREAIGDDSAAEADYVAARSLFFGAFDGPAAAQ